MVEGAPLLRAYGGKTSIEGSNPSLSAKHKKTRGPKAPCFFMLPVHFCARCCLTNVSTHPLFLPIAFSAGAVFMRKDPTRVGSGSTCNVG